jgi:hypothetical protein
MSPLTRLLPTQDNTDTPMPYVDFEPTIPVYEQAKTFQTLGSAATVVGIFQSPLAYIHKFVTGCGTVCSMVRFSPSL